MTAVIQIKRSETAAAQPESLSYGELGINLTDKKIYIGNSSGATTLLIDGNAVGGGGVSSFNTRTGAITLTSSDVTTALGFTPTAYTAPTLGSTTLTSGTTITTVAGLTSVTSTSFVGALTGNASTVTNGVYTTDTGTVTNTMLAGSIAYSKLNLTGSILNTDLANSSITVNGTSISLGGSATIKATATNALTLGTGLTGSSYDGSTLVTAAVDTSTIATRAYVDSVAQGLHTHATVDTATTAKLATLTGTTVSYSGGAITWTGGTAATAAGFNDGTTLTASTTESSASKILIKNEGDAGGLGSSKNGTYYVYGTRELRRTSDGDAAADWKGGDFCFVTQGTSYNNTGWVQTEVVTTLDTDPILWEQFSGAGTYTADEITLTKTGSVFSIKSTYVGQTSITTLGTIATGTWNATAIGETKGGTNQTTYAAGDLLYSSATNTLSKLAKPASLTSFLQMTAAGVPSWTSTIPTTNGGTGLTSFTSGGILYASSTSALTTGSVFTVTNNISTTAINVTTNSKQYHKLYLNDTNTGAPASIQLYTSNDAEIPTPTFSSSALEMYSNGVGGVNKITMHSIDGVFTINQSSDLPLNIICTPNTWGESLQLINLIETGSFPQLIVGDDGNTYAVNNITFEYDSGGTSNITINTTTLKINTGAPVAGKVLTCTASNGTCEWQDNAGADLVLFNMGFI